MKITNGLMVFCGALVGCTTYVEQPRSQPAYVPPQPTVYVAPPPAVVYVQPPAAVQTETSIGSIGVVIRTESDFYEPLGEYGRWEIVGSHGRCWIPNRVDREWRPYCNGNWERTDAGWYWASDEPWGWATYHYGRWDLSPQLGWYWVPQTQWSPAWVSWHEGGGYVGWAPLQPSARVTSAGSITVNIALIAPRAFVFVEPKHFMQPIRPTTVVVNNTTIINKTVNITNIKIVNNTVINEGPRTQIIEQASGQPVRAVPARELRHKHEAEVLVHQRTASAGGEKRETSVRGQVEPRETKIQTGAPQNARESASAQAEEARVRLKESSGRTAEVKIEQREKAEALAQEQLQRTVEQSKRLAASAAQEQLQRKAQEEKRATQVQTQREANEAKEKDQPHGRNLQKKAQAETSAGDVVENSRGRSQPHGKASEQAGPGNSGGDGKLEPIANERGKSNQVNKKKKGKDHQSSEKPESPNDTKSEKN